LGSGDEARRGGLRESEFSICLTIAAAVSIRAADGGRQFDDQYMAQSGSARSPFVGGAAASRQPAVSYSIRQLDLQYAVRALLLLTSEPDGRPQLRRVETVIRVARQGGESESVGRRAVYPQRDRRDLSSVHPDQRRSPYVPTNSFAERTVAPLEVLATDLNLML
jgi:hypothetical protein